MPERFELGTLPYEFLADTQAAVDRRGVWRRLGPGDTGGLRIGLAPYDDTEDADRLLTGLSEFLTFSPALTVRALPRAVPP